MHHPITKLKAKYQFIYANSSLRNVGREHKVSKSSVQRWVKMKDADLLYAASRCRTKSLDQTCHSFVAEMRTGYGALSRAEHGDPRRTTL